MTSAIYLQMLDPSSRLKQHYIYSHEDTYFCKVRKDSKFEELQRLRSVVLPGSIELLMDG